MQAALKADQNIKLAIFATRPAIYVPLFNFISEMMGTAMLLLGALLIELSVRRGQEHKLQCFNITRWSCYCRILVWNYWYATGTHCDGAFAIGM